MQSKQEIRKGRFIFEYVGETVTNTELMQQRALQKLEKLEAFMLALDAYWKSEEVVINNGALCMDSTSRKNASHFLNHRYLPLVPCHFNDVHFDD